MEHNQAQGWHVARWDRWGWIETVLKLIGVAAGVIAFLQVSGAGDYVISGNPRLAAVVVAAVLTLVAIFQLVLRIGQRELISLVFAILNLLGHLAVVAALLQAADATTLPLIFGVVYVLGQLAKLQWLHVTGYTEGGMDLRGMYLFTGSQTALYVLFAVLLLV